MLENEDPKQMFSLWKKDEVFESFVEGCISLRVHENNVIKKLMSKEETFTDTI